jgi:hypothetical protein
MTAERKFKSSYHAARFNRQFFEGIEDFTAIGGGSYGGKAGGLAFIRDILAGGFPHEKFPGITVNIPRLTVLGTEVFDAFLRQNNLHDIGASDLPDDRIAHAFQAASFPATFVGDLMALIAKVKQPLAIRSSSMLEDALEHPFAGVYATKMIPNNQLDVETRFHKLIEAVKFVYASTFFKEAKDSLAAAGRGREEEKMAVIIQEVVGLRHGERFYPHFSGVGRSFSYYPTGHARPEQGVVNLALGLGKTVVDGGICWPFSPAFPAASPPFASAHSSLHQTQSRFWAVNVGKPPAYDPIRETEYLFNLGLQEAEEDGVLPLLASTFDPQSDRLLPGTDVRGPRVLNFAPLLVYEVLPVGQLIRTLLRVCEDAVGLPVEIEFAVTLGAEPVRQARLGFLQVRPMNVSDECVEIADEEMTGERVLAASEDVMGNGRVNSLCDIVYVRPETFEARRTPVIAEEVAAVNRILRGENRPYVLIGFGRWGSTDPWLGIPVNWSQISSAKVIVEAMLPQMNVEPSQGSHFFHNLSSFQVSYFCVPPGGGPLDWEWLERQPAVSETGYVRQLRLPRPLEIRVDGRTRRGVICHD